jgi:putative aminopeptidase FrvX
MQKESRDFLNKLLKTPSPTGSEQKIQKVVKERMQKYADTIHTDLHGNLIIGINTKAPVRVMLAGHCDQIAMMVSHISDEGFISVQALGGIDTGVLQGSHLTIYTEQGPIEAVVGRKPIHLQTPEERGKSKSEIKDIWLDIGRATKKEVEKLVQIGDVVTFKLGVTELGKDYIVSPGLDDKVGLFVAMESLRLCSGKKSNVALYAVSTVQEEVGLRGARTAAYSVDPHVGIAIDVTHSNDNPGKGDKKTAPCKLGSGPCIVRGPNINHIVEKMLLETAKKGKIPYQIEPNASLLGNDANAIQVSRAGVAAASIGIPNRYMHTQVEICHLKDLENSAKLLSAFVLKIGARADFTPR